MYGSSHLPLKIRHVFRDRLTTAVDSFYNNSWRVFWQSQSVSDHPPKLSRSYLGNSSAAARWANKKTIVRQAVFADAVEKAQGAGGSLAHITGTASKVAEQACPITGVLTLWRKINAVEVQILKSKALWRSQSSTCSRHRALPALQSFLLKLITLKGFDSDFWKAGLNQRFWCGMSCSLALTLCVKRQKLGQRLEYSKSKAG